MSSAEPKMGDRVRVTYEGEVCVPASKPGNHFWVKTGRNTHLAYQNSPDYSIEVIEPEYIVGEVYQDAKGDKYQRLPGKNLGWRPVKAWQYSRACDVGQDYPTRPLTRLVPENG